MLHELTMKNWVKHHNRTFHFMEGVNLIRGENEGGKSLILEAIDFALHGSVALRLPVSMYPTNLQVDLTVTIRGETYQICRTPKKATLYRGTNMDEVIASGTKPVDAEIRKILGYNRNVFMVSNYSSQDAIQYLSQMKPAERKRTIDNVVGLTAVEQVLVDHKTNLSYLKKDESSFKSREVQQPVEPTIMDFNPMFVECIAELKGKVNSLHEKILNQQNNQRQHQALDQTKPAPFKMLSVDGLLSIGVQEIKNIRLHRQRLEDKKQTTLEQYNKHCLNKVERPDDVDLSDLIEGLTNVRIQTGKLKRQELVDKIAFFEKEIAKFPDISGEQYVPVSEIESVAEQEKLYQDWLEVQRLKEKGSITCNHCEGEVLLAVDHIKKHYSHVPEMVEKPLVASQELINKNKDLEYITQATKEYKVELESFRNQLADFDAQWYSDIALDKHIAALEREEQYHKQMESYQTWFDTAIQLDQAMVEAEQDLDDFNKKSISEAELVKAEQAMANHLENQRNKQILEQWQKSKDALEPFNAEALADAEQQYAVETQRYDLNVRAQSEWTEYFHQLEKYDDWVRDYAQASFDVEQEQLAIDTLNVFKGKIKTTILPSVNSVASTWLRRMSEGKHHSVELTEAMDILVNGEPIEALSISGRALGHLSLRMALGQVLTNSVFPVFMADEVDASMRNNRAQAVLDALTDMLNGSMKQIIMISHRDLDRVDNVIEV